MGRVKDISVTDTDGALSKVGEGGGGGGRAGLGISSTATDSQTICTFRCTVAALR